MRPPPRGILLVRMLVQRIIFERDKGVNEQEIIFKEKHIQMCTVGMRKNWRCHYSHEN